MLETVEARALEQFCSKLHTPLQQKNVQLINEVIQSYKNKKLISSTIQNKIKPPSNFKEWKFYILPKTRKPKDQWINNYMPKGRPIISNLSSETSNLSKYITEYLNLFIINLPYILKNSYQLIDKLNFLTFPADAILFTADFTTSRRIS